jgi:hypothetical protein
VLKNVLLGLAMLVVGGALAFGGGRTLYRAHASQGWPSAQGKVLSSSVETVRSKRSVSFRPRVRYSYSVAGASHASESLTFSGGALGGGFADADAFVRRFPVGTEVTVHYSPEDVDLVCIDCQRVSLADYVISIVGVLLVGLALKSLLETLRFELSQRNPRGALREPTR